MILDSTSATIFGTIIRAAKANADCSTVPPENLDAVTHQIYAAVSMSAPDDLAPLFEDLSPNAQESLAIRHLEDAVYRAVKGLTA